MRFRRAIKDDAAFIVNHVNQASEGLSYYIWDKFSGPKIDPWDVGIARARSETFPISYTNAWILESENNNVGFLICHSSSDTPHLINDEQDILRPVLELENHALSTCYLFALSVEKNIKVKALVRNC